MYLFSSILPQGLWTYLNKTSSNSAALFTDSVRRRKEKFIPPQTWYTFSFFFFSYIIWDMARNKTYQESQMEPKSQQPIPGHAFWIIYFQQPLWRRLAVYCMSLHMTAEKQYSQVWFSQLFFNALLVCPLISPLVRVCLSTHMKYNLTCDNFVTEPNDIFSKAKIVDKGWLWIYLSWNVYVRLGWVYASASQSCQKDNSKNLFLLKFFLPW